MIKDIIIEIEGVQLADFNAGFKAAPYTEETESGISLLFNDVEELKSYHNSLVSKDDTAGEEKNDTKAKVAAAVKKAMRRNEAVLDAVRTYAEYLFSFIFNADAHRKDRLLILDTVIADVQESNDSLELQKAVLDATFELGDLSKNDKSKFYDYVHNQADYYFDKIKESLITELTDLRKGLLG